MLRPLLAAAAAAAAVGVVLWGAWQPNGRGGGCCRALVEENGVNRRRNSCLKQLSQERALRAGRAAGHCWEELRGVGGAARVQEARLGAPPSPPSLMAAAILAWGAPGKNGLIRRSSAGVWPKRPYFVPQRMACFAHTSEGSGLLCAGEGKTLLPPSRTGRGQLLAPANDPPLYSLVCGSTAAHPGLILLLLISSLAR